MDDFLRSYNDADASLDKREFDAERSRTGVGSATHTPPIPARRIGRFIKRAFVKAIIGGLLLTSPFLILAAVYWSSAEARGILLYLAGCFALAGCLFGIGSELIHVFGTKQPEQSPGEHGRHLASELAEKLVPDPVEPILQVAKVVTWLVRKDYRKQSPGRGKRALVGAIVLGFVAIVFFGILLLVHKEFAQYSISDSLFLLLGVFLGGGAIGALLGVLSDSF